MALSYRAILDQSATTQWSQYRLRAIGRSNQVNALHYILRNRCIPKKLGVCWTRPEKTQTSAIIENYYGTQFVNDVGDGGMSCIPTLSCVTEAVSTCLHFVTSSTGRETKYPHAIPPVMSKAKEIATSKRKCVTPQEPSKTVLSGQPAYTV